MKDPAIQARANGAGHGPPTARPLYIDEPELEEGVLGSVIRQAELDESDELARVVADLLTEDDFSTEERRTLFRAIKHVVEHSPGAPPDSTLVTVALREHGVERPAHVVLNHQRYTASPQVLVYKLLEQRIKRQLFDLGDWIRGEVSAPMGDDVWKLYDEMGRRLHDIGAFKRREEYASEAVDEAFEAVLLPTENEGRVVGLDTGLKALNKATGGFRGSRLYVFGADTGVGKTNLCVYFARKLALEQNRPGVIYSVEMTTEEMLERMILAIAEVDGDDVREGRLTAEDRHRLEQAREVIRKAPLRVVRVRRMDISEVRQDMRRAKANDGAEWFAFDYIQRGKAKSFNPQGKVDEIGIITEELKDAAEELDVPVLAYSQVTRSAGKAGALPTKHDLRGSGEIENDADFVGLMHRPELCGMDVWEELDNCPTKGLLLLNVDKNRLGPFLGVQAYTFVERYLDFKDGRPAGGVSYRPAGEAPF